MTHETTTLLIAVNLNHGGTVSLRRCPATFPTSYEGEDFSYTRADADEPAALDDFPPRVSDAALASLPKNAAGVAVDGEGREERKAACRAAFGRVQTKLRNPLRDRCTKRRTVIAMVRHACAWGLSSEDLVELAREALIDPTEDAWIREIDSEIRTLGAIPEFDSLGRRFEQEKAQRRQLEDEKRARDAAREEARRAREMRPNEETLRALGVDACLEVRHKHQDAARRFFDVVSFASLPRGVFGQIDFSALPSDGDSSFILVNNDGRAVDGPQPLAPGVKLRSLNDVVRLPVRDMRKRYRAPELMSQLRAESLDRRPMVEADFLDPESVEGRHNFERGLEDGSSLIEKAVSSCAAMYGGNAAVVDLLDRMIRGRKIFAEVAIDAIHAAGVEAWWERHPKPKGWDAEQIEDIKRTQKSYSHGPRKDQLVDPPKWEDLYPLPSRWTKAMLMDLAHGVVDGTRALSSPGEFVEEPTPSFFDRVVKGLRTDPWRAPLSSFVEGRDVVRTEEITAFLRSEGLLEGELVPQKHYRIVAILKDAGLAKGNATIDGRQVKAFRRVAISDPK